MEKVYIQSLQMIKQLNIKNEKEYNKLLKDYLILSSESLKYIIRTRKFKKIIRLAEKGPLFIVDIFKKRWYYIDIKMSNLKS